MLVWHPSPQHPKASVCNICLHHPRTVTKYFAITFPPMYSSGTIPVIFCSPCSRGPAASLIKKLGLPSRGHVPSFFSPCPERQGDAILQSMNSSTEASGHILGYLCISVTWKICSKQGLESISPKSKVSRLIISFQPSVRQQSISVFVLDFSRRN